MKLVLVSKASNFRIISTFVLKIFEIRAMIGRRKGIVDKGRLNWRVYIQRHHGILFKAGSQNMALDDLTEYFETYPEMG